jgi:DNA primase
MSSSIYEDFARKHLDIINVSGEEAMVRCVVHDDSKASMQFNLRTGLWVCFACHEGGSIKRLCRELGIPIAAEPEPDLDDIYAKITELGKEPKKGNKGVQPESLLKRYSIPTRYWAERGFDKKTVKAFDLGNDPMNDAVTIPLRNDAGQLLGVIKRYLGDDVELRYRYPKGFKRSLNLFASWLLEHTDTDTVAICEGSLDAIKCWMAGVPAVAVYGSSISRSQIRLLRQLGVGHVVLFFDNDKAGWAANDLCVGIKHHSRAGRNGERVQSKQYDPHYDLRRWFLVSQVKYQKGWADDPGALTPKQIRKAVSKARLLNVS